MIVYACNSLGILEHGAALPLHMAGLGEACLIPTMHQAQGCGPGAKEEGRR